jgi:hypothetical protein
MIARFSTETLQPPSGFKPQAAVFLEIARFLPASEPFYRIALRSRLEPASSEGIKP